MKTIIISKFLSSKYAISLIEAKKIVEANSPADDEIVFDFLNIEVASSPFIRTLLTAYVSPTPSIKNAKEMIADKWKQVMDEKESRFDIYKAIKELES